jgi:hypothetical protein
MSTVFMHAVVSVDGFIADAEDNVDPLFEWYFNGDTEIVDGGPFKVSRDSIRYVQPMWQRIGTTVMGRHLFDLIRCAQPRHQNERRSGSTGVTALRPG